MSVTIRGAAPADAHEIAGVHVASWRTTYRGIVPQEYLDALDVAARAERWKEEFARGGSHIFVAEDGDSICGFISGGKLRETVGTYDCEIYAVYLLSEMQRRSFGRKLMRALATSLARDGYMQPLVWVLRDNPSCHFYERLGGMPVSEKRIDIGGAQLMEVAYGWQNIGELVCMGAEPREY